MSKENLSPLLDEITELSTKLEHKTLDLYQILKDRVESGNIQEILEFKTIYTFLNVGQILNVMSKEMKTFYLSLSLPACQKDPLLLGKLEAARNSTKAHPEYCECESCKKVADQAVEMFQELLKKETNKKND